MQKHPSPEYSSYKTRASRQLSCIDLGVIMSRLLSIGQFHKSAPHCGKSAIDLQSEFTKPLRVSLVKGIVGFSCVNHRANQIDNFIVSAFLLKGRPLRPLCQEILQNLFAVATSRLHRVIEESFSGLRSCPRCKEQTSLQERLRLNFLFLVICERRCHHSAQTKE